MKKLLYVVSIVVVCFLVIFLLKKPIASFDTNQSINVRYESLDDWCSTSSTITLPSSDNEALHDILQERAWYIPDNFSDFFLSQNHISQSDNTITFFGKDMMLTISSNGVIYNIQNEKYAYISLINNQEKCKEIYEEVYALISDQITQEQKID